MEEEVVLKKKLTIFKYRRARNTGIYIRPTFSHAANTYQITHESSGAIWESVATRNCVLKLWLMTEPSDMQPISQHPIYGLLSFLVMLLFSSICTHLKITCGEGMYFWKFPRLWKHSFIGEILLK